MTLQSRLVLRVVCSLALSDHRNIPIPGRLPTRASNSAAATRRLRPGELLRHSGAPAGQHLPHSWQPPAIGVRGAVRVPVLGDGVPEALRVLLPEVLRGVPLRAAGHLRQQAVLPLLRPLEDQEGRAQMSLYQLSGASTGAVPVCSSLHFQ